MSCPSHNLDKQCKAEECTAKGDPYTCKDCHTKARRSLCRIHRRKDRNPNQINAKKETNQS